MKDLEPTKITDVLRRMYFDERAHGLYGLPVPPDFTEAYRRLQEEWERRQDEMRAGIVSLAEYRARRHG